MKKQCILFLSTTLLITAIACKKNSASLPITINVSDTAGAENKKVLHLNLNGNVNDASGNHLDGIVYPASPVSYAADRFGRAGMAMLLGDSGIIVTPSLKDQQISFPFSVSIWFNAPQVDSLTTIIQADAIAQSSSAADYLYYNGYYLQLGGTDIAPGTGKISFTYGNNICACRDGRTTIYAPGSVTAGDWYHVVVNVNGPGENMEMYVNGVKQTTVNYEVSYSASVITWHSPGTGIVGPFGLIGQNINPAYNYQKFKGLVDDYRVYKKTLNKNEVLALYNATP
jgi:hypothetical protein